MTPKSENDQSDLSLKIRPHFLFIVFHICNEKLSNIKNKQIVETLLLTSHG